MYITLRVLTNSVSSFSKYLLKACHVSGPVPSPGDSVKKTTVPNLLHPLCQPGGVGVWPWEKQELADSFQPNKPHEATCLLCSFSCSFSKTEEINEMQINNKKPSAQKGPLGSKHTASFVGHSSPIASLSLLRETDGMLIKAQPPLLPDFKPCQRNFRDPFRRRYTPETHSPRSCM